MSGSGTRSTSTGRVAAAYYLPPGHNLVVDEDIEIIEFTPTAQRNQTMEHVAKVMAAGE